LNVKGLIVRSFARESVFGPLVAAGFLALGSRFTFLKLIDNPELRDGITAAIVLGLGGLGARQTSFSPATHGAAVAAASIKTVQELKPDDLVSGNIVPVATEPEVARIANEVAGSAGGLAGRLAEQTVNRVLSTGTSMVAKRFGKLLRRG
jgi:hypothetical protein